MSIDDRGKHTLAYPWIRLSTTDFTGTDALTSPTPTTTAPSGDGVIDLQGAGLSITTDDAHCPDMLMVQPYGSDAANENFVMQAYGWQTFDEPTDTTNHLKLWVPMLLVECTVTLGSITFTDVLASGLLADTITLDKGNSSLHTFSSPANDLPAYLIVDPLGSRYVEFKFDLDAGGSAAAAANCLVRGMS